MSKGEWLIGIDEAGRGPLAGPVSLAAVAWESGKHSMLAKRFAGAKECKQLSPKQREEWFEKIEAAEREGWLKIGAAFSGNRLIDQRGITGAIQAALNHSLAQVVRQITPHQNFQHRMFANRHVVLLDGGLRAPERYANQRTIVRGDESELIIALASIVAKVRRDRHLVRLSRLYPGYGLERHKGYGTRAHYLALGQLGPAAIHRLSFLTRAGLGSRA
jgi:ribonuclease HII